ncbi:hypothetical protein IWW48_000887 [Coemansia sp. RSA 1200]|nr:hypothetical protein IWW48_000887 [Coemansia sp. RSA 1200]
MARFFIPSNAADAGASCFGLSQHSTGAAASSSCAELFYHPAVRQEVALDMSLKKLHSIKQAQRSSHRQADLLKTVLVYNMFKAAMCGNGEGESPSSSSLPDKEECASGAVEMDVDAGGAGAEEQSSGFGVDRVAPTDSETAAAEAAEQSWFDRCIDRMLTEDELENDDDDCDMSSAPVLLGVAKPSLGDAAAADDAEFSDPRDSASLFLEDATVAPSAASYSDEISSSSSHVVPSSGFLKRSPSSASIQSLCMQHKQQQQQENDDESALRLLATASSHHQNQNQNHSSSDNNNSNNSTQRRHRALSNDSTSDAVIGRGEAAAHAASFTIHVGSHHHSPSSSPSWQFANFYTSRNSERTAVALTQ